MVVGFVEYVLQTTITKIVANNWQSSCSCSGIAISVDEKSVWKTSAS